MCVNLEKHFVNRHSVNVIDRYVLEEKVFKEGSPLFLRCMCGVTEYYTHDCALENRYIKIVIGCSLPKYPSSLEFLHNSKNEQMRRDWNPVPEEPEKMFTSRIVSCIQCPKCKQAFAFSYKGELCQLR